MKVVRKAYAKKSSYSKQVLMFKSKALRDFFLENVEGYENATCDEYRKAEREENKHDGSVSDYNAIDMGVAEYWDNWWDVYDRAFDKGLF